MRQPLPLKIKIFELKPTLITIVQPGNKKSFFSIDISPKNRFSVSMEKISASKNRLKEK